MRIREDKMISEFVDNLNSVWTKMRSDLYDKNTIAVTEKFEIPRGNSPDEKIGTVYRSDGFLKISLLIDGKKSGLKFTELRESRRPIDPQILYDIIIKIFKDHGINVFKIDVLGWSITYNHLINYVLTTDIKVKKIILG